jgi:ribulose-phosphate 3-epimerase
MIIPTIFEKEFSKAEIKIREIEQLVKWAQVDVVDGIFTSGKTFELELLANINESMPLLWDIHLMTKEPRNWINKCVFVGASRVIGQVEMMKDRQAFAQQVKEEGMEAGLAFDIDSEVDGVPEDIDLVLLMSRKAGFAEMPMDQRIEGKIKRTAELRSREGLNFEIAIDGAVDPENIGRLVKAGAEIFYCGKSVWDGRVADNLELLNQAENDQ